MTSDLCGSQIMNRQSHRTSQASKNNKFNDGSSQQLTLNITLKDLNIEARKILRKKLLRDNLKTSRDEKDVYVSGPYFPCGDYKLKKRSKKDSISSVAENFTNDEGISSRTGKSPSVEIIIKEDKSNLTELSSEVEAGKVKVFGSDKGSTLNKIKVPILSVSDLTDEQISKLSKPEEKQCVTNTTEQGTRNNELLEERKKQRPDSGNSRRPSSKLYLKSLEEKQSVTITTEKCLQEGRSSQAENTRLLEDKRYQPPRSPNSRRPSSQLEPRSRGTTPLSERRRESRTCGNENKASPNHDHFGLENILNPLLRESLKKILNPQSYVEDFNSIPNDPTDHTTARNGCTIFKEDILLPKIKRRIVKYNSLDYGDESKRSSVSINSLSNKYRKRSTKRVRFIDNKQSPELSSTKCTGTMVTRSRPVRMLSDGSEYTVKGLLGQWLKRRSGNTVQAGKEKASVEKQEAYREVQLLKVGLSMRMLAAIG